MCSKRNWSNINLINTMNNLTLTEEHLKQLDGFIQEMPTKYGLPLINFFNKIRDEVETLETKDNKKK